MAEMKYVINALSRLSQDTAVDLAGRSDVGKWAIEHYLERAGSNRLERWRLLLALDDQIASKMTAVKNDQFWSTMRNIITQLLNEQPGQPQARETNQWKP